MLFRFRVADEPEAQALVYLGLGEARRQLGDGEAALQAFTEALRLYQECGNPLGQSDACGGLANVLVEQGAPEATERFSQAVALVEQVGDAIADAGGRAAFYDTRAALYADVIADAAQAQDGERVRALVEQYRGCASKSGRLALAQRIQEFEHVIPVRSADLTTEEAEHNKTVTRLLAEARRALKREAISSAMERCRCRCRPHPPAPLPQGEGEPEPLATGDGGASEFQRRNH